ncbi:unnamed protein product [Heligmosomoides polygyrus]|uniref:Ulp1 protease family, C-terminal catalytic domain containing protein n=1 Tax=Heligmosomoides polygyrus TaxID=6339 RepID=A0A183F2C4_HELPZ|nr:unnamed protein product [Heligmosomoides polygyrus]
MPPTSDYDDDKVEAFYVELKKVYKEDSLPTMDLRSSTRDRTTDSFAQGPAFQEKKVTKKRSCRTIINWDLFTFVTGLWEDTVMYNIDEEYDRLVHHRRDSAKATA